MKSFLLQQLARLILPLSVMLGLALLLKGHDAPGGGFVGGLSIAVAGILAVTAYGARAYRARIPLAAEDVALLGALLLFASVGVPQLLGLDPLTHGSGTLEIGGRALLEWQSALAFDLGVVLAVSGGLAAAATWLWEARSVGAPRKPRDADRAGGGFLR